MEDNEYLDVDEFDPESDYILQEDEDDRDDPFSLDEEELDEGDEVKIKAAEYEGKLTEYEIHCITEYNNIMKADDLEDAAAAVLSVNPQHNSSLTVNYILKEMFGKQGHNRMQNLQFTPLGLVTGRDIDAVLEEDDSSEFNDQLREAWKDQIARFVNYLATRDLSKDSAVSARKKQRQLPAFIIFLFSSDFYSFITNCPTMPKVYQDQINLAFKRLNEMKQSVVDELADAYDKAGRPKVAERVRDRGISWFNKEPAEIRGAAEYRDLELTQDDVNIYREYRPKYTNISVSLTQDVISSYIRVVEDEKKGISRQLKDKTRADAIADVKKLYNEWAKTQGKESEELAKQLIFRD